MFLYLTSTAAETLDKLIPLLPKPAKDLKVAFIPTAGDIYQETPWIEKDKNKLIELGFQLKVIDIKNNQNLEKDIAETDIIFIAGGSPTYLLQQMQKNNCFDLIQQKIKEGIIFIGSSAGSMIVGPNIEFDHIYATEDKEMIKLDSYEALNIVKFVVLPHANKSEYLECHQKVIDKYKNKYNFKILKDNQAILVTDEKTQLIEA